MEQSKMLIFIFCFLSLAHCELYHCPHPPTQNTDLQFTEEFGPTKVVYVCDLHYLELFCCMAHTTQILWFQEYEGSWRDFSTVPYRKEERSLSPDNQTAVIQRAIWNDAGKYKCTGHGTISGLPAVKENILQLNVIDCTSTWSDRPLPMYPPELETVLHSNLTENISIPCRGFYGRLDECSGCVIQWLKQTSHGNDVIISDNDMQREYTTNDFTWNNVGMESVLHVNGVSEADYNSKYICRMSNSFGSSELKVLVQKPEDPNSPVLVHQLYWVGLLVCVGVVLVGLAAVRHWRFDLDIRLLIKSKQKTTGHALKHDIIVLSVGEDHNFTDYLVKKLTDELHFRVFYAENDITGGCMFTRYSDEVKNSRAILVVLSPDFIRDKTYIKCIMRNSVIEDSIIFVLYRFTKPECLEAMSEHCKDDAHVQDTVKRSTTITWPRQGAENEADFLITKKKENFGKEAQFWKQLRLALPNALARRGQEIGIEGNYATSLRHEREYLA